MITDFAPIAFLDVNPEFVRCGLNPFPGCVLFGVGDSLHLVKSRNCITDVCGVVDRFFSLGGKGELLAWNLVAVFLVELAHRMERAGEFPLRTLLPERM